MSSRRKAYCILTVALLGCCGLLAAIPWRTRDRAIDDSTPARAKRAPSVAAPAVALSAGPRDPALERGRRLLNAAMKASAARETIADHETALEAFSNASAERTAERLESARRRFAAATLNTELSREVDAELRWRLDSMQVDSRGLSEVECREMLCRAEMLVSERSLGRMVSVARQSNLVSTAVEVQRRAAGELRLLAYLERGSEQHE